MKIPLFRSFICVLICSLSLSSLHATVRLGLKAGLNFSQAALSTSGENYDLFVHHGAEFGFLMEGSLPVRHLYYNTGILISQMGTEYETPPEKAPGKTSHYDGFYRINYLQLPLNISYKVPVKNIPVKVLFSAGMYYGYAFSGKQELKRNIFSLISQKMENDFCYNGNLSFGNASEDRFKKHDFGLKLGLGLEMNEHVLIGFDYKYGLVNINNTHYKNDIMKEHEKIKNRCWTLYIAYLF